jgi:hypothetical protein
MGEFGENSHQKCVICAAGICVWTVGCARLFGRTGA